MARYFFVESSEHGLIRIALAPQADKPPQVREWAEFDTIGIFSVDVASK
jgi:hypothetical protein